MNATSVPVSLQINLAPSDLAHARFVLPHQLRTWAGQVSEIVFAVDLKKGYGPRFAGWTESLPGLRRLVDESCEQYPHARIVEIDYTDSGMRKVADDLFGGRAIPLKDWNGTAVYPYFFGLWAAESDYVFHMDSDMMFGGGSSTWVAEALTVLVDRTDVLACNPLPGPPTATGRLTSQELVSESEDSAVYRADQLSTRLFLMDRARLHARVGAIPLTRPVWYRVWQARAEGRPPYDLAEAMLSRAMVENGLSRIDFLGTPPGMWSIHPPFRSKLFYDTLPQLIERIESGDMPEAQRGDHDVNDSLVDWTSARLSRSQRARQHADLLAHHGLDVLRQAGRRSAPGSSTVARSSADEPDRT